MTKRNWTGKWVSNEIAHARASLPALRVLIPGAAHRTRAATRARGCRLLNLHDVRAMAAHRQAVRSGRRGAVSPEQQPVHAFAVHE